LFLVVVYKSFYSLKYLLFASAVSNTFVDGAFAAGSLLSVLENKPLNRCTSEARRKKTREPFVQDGPCYDVTPKLMKCRECKMSQGQRNGSIAGSQLANNIFCRFYAFRKQVF